MTPAGCRNFPCHLPPSTSSPPRSSPARAFALATVAPRLLLRHRSRESTPRRRTAAPSATPHHRAPLRTTAPPRGHRATVVVHAAVFNAGRRRHAPPQVHVWLIRVGLGLGLELIRVRLGFR